jgi:AcrR family transcriptional regulator
LSSIYHGLVCLYKEKVRPHADRFSAGTPRKDTAFARDEHHAATNRRAEIIAAAIQVIARDSIRACTISALEHETGFARGHFTYHFRSKDEIIGLAFAAVGSDWATAQVEATVGDTARERFERRVRAAVAWVQRRPDSFRCLMSFQVEMMRNPDAFPPAARIRSQIWEPGAQMIRDGTAEGAFHPRTDPAIEARTIFALVDGLLMHSVMDPSFCPAGELGARVWAVVADRLGIADHAAAGGNPGGRAR